MNLIFITGEKKMRECNICGNVFDEHHTRQIYCCPECARTAQISQIVAHNREHRQKKLIICKICGLPVQAVHGAVGSQRPRLHYDCIIQDLIDTASSGKEYSKTQKFRKMRLGITNKEIEELQCR